MEQITPLGFLTTVLFFVGLSIAPTATGRNSRQVFLAGTVLTTLFAICVGQVLLLWGFSAGALWRSYWRNR